MTGATLIVDLGGTLFRRTGALALVTQTLRTYSDQITDPVRRRVVADAVLTLDSPSRAADFIVGYLGLGHDRRHELLSAMMADSEPTVVLPNAESLLASAAEMGWRVVAATNAAAWAPPLPAGLAQYIDLVVSSAMLGLGKDHPRFWEQLSSVASVDPALSVVVGDDCNCDVLVPRAAGYTAVHATGPSVLGELAAAIRQVGRPPRDVVGLVVDAARCEWAGATVLETVNLVRLLAGVTRMRVRLHPDATTSIDATLVRRRDGVPVITLDDSSEPPPRYAWISRRRDSRSTRLPADLAQALHEHGATLDHIPLHERRYLISLVREAQDGHTRTQRVAEIVKQLATRPTDG